MLSYLLYDNSKNNKKFKIMAKNNCIITIDYGNSKQHVLLDKHDQIRFDYYVILNYKNYKGLYCDHYKYHVDTEYIKIYCNDAESLEYIEYND